MNRPARPQYARPLSRSAAGCCLAILRGWRDNMKHRSPPVRRTAHGSVQGHQLVRHVLFLHAQVQRLLVPRCDENDVEQRAVHGAGGAVGVEGVKAV